jgi:hypothetical protein
MELKLSIYLTAEENRVRCNSDVSGLRYDVASVEAAPLPAETSACFLQRAMRKTHGKKRSRPHGSGCAVQGMRPCIQNLYRPSVAHRRPSRRQTACFLPGLRMQRVQDRQIACSVLYKDRNGDYINWTEIRTLFAGVCVAGAQSSGFLRPASILFDCSDFTGVTVTPKEVCLWT